MNPDKTATIQSFKVINEDPIVVHPKWKLWIAKVLKLEIEARFNYQIQLTINKSGGFVPSETLQTIGGDMWRIISIMDYTIVVVSYKPMKKLHELSGLIWVAFSAY